MKMYINNRENLRKKPIFDLSIKNRQIAFCFNPPFGILSFSSYVDIESMNVILRDVTRKKIDEIDRLETELKEKEELKYIEDCKNSDYYQI